MYLDIMSNFTCARKKCQKSRAWYTPYRIDIRAIKDNKFETVIVVEVLSFYLIHFGGTYENKRRMLPYRKYTVKSFNHKNTSPIITIF